MAEGWARRLKSEVIDARSAGTAPKGVDPLAVRAMAEAGVDISGQHSTDVLEFMDERFDYAVTLCGDVREACPVFPGEVKLVHAGFDDPPALAAGEPDEEAAMAHYRRVRDEIRAFVETLPEGLESPDV